MPTISVDELERILLTEIRWLPGCRAVEQVTVVGRPKGDWICGTVRPGKADATIARDAAGKLERRLRSVYSLEPRSPSF
jgi:hypothetical protein